MRILRLVVLWLGAWSLASSLSAQDLLPSRFEKELPGRFANCTGYPVGEAGIILIAENELGSAGSETVDVELISPGFESMWKVQLELPVRRELLHSQTRDSILFLLFKSVIRGRSQLQLLAIDALTGKSRTYQGPSTLATISTFLVTSREAILGGSNRRKAWCYRIDLQSGEGGELRMSDLKRSTVADLDLAPDETTTEVLITGSPSGKVKTARLLTLPFGESPQDETVIEPSTGENILRGRVCQLKNGDRMIVGTYAKPLKSGSQGMFLARIKEGEGADVKLYSFTEFEHFFDYLPPKSEARVKRKIRRREEAGDELTLYYQLRVHDLIEMDNRIILVAEAYYAQYHTEWRTTTNFVNGRWVTTRTSYQVFDGWNTTHAVVAAFNQEGEKLWDYCIKIGILTFNPGPRMRIATTGPYEAEAAVLNFTMVTKYKIEPARVQPLGMQGIATGNEGDRIKWSYANDIAWLFDDTFISWGIQRIKNTETRERRLVFYLNKIEF